jgi:hypothetical protein
VTEHLRPANGEAASDTGTWAGLILAGGLLVLGAVMKVVYFEHITGGQFSSLTYPDEINYYLPAAKGIIAEGLDWFGQERSLWTGPVNPLWIALLGAQPTLVKLANVALSMVTGALVFDTARRLYGRRAGLWALIFYSVSVPFYVFVPTLLTEPLFTPLLIASLWLLVVSNSHPERWALPGISGLLVGVATLTRPTTQYLPVFLVLVVLTTSLALRNRHAQGEVKILWRNALLVTAGATMVVVPYVVKNNIQFDRAAVANGLGAVLYLGNDLRKNGDEPLYSEMNFDTFEITAPWTHLDTEGDKLLTEVALERIKERPLDTGLLQIEKTARLLFGSTDHYFWPYRDAISHIEARGTAGAMQVWDMVSTSLLVIFGFLGMALVTTALMPRLFLIGTIAYFVIVHTLLFPIPRMILPVLPLLSVFAAGFVAHPRRRPALVGVASMLAVIVVIGLSGRLLPERGVTERYITYFEDVALDGAGDPIELEGLIEDGEGLISSEQEPFVVFDSTDFDALSNQIIFVTLDTTGPDDAPSSASARLYWARHGESFSEDRSSEFTIYFQSDLTYAVSPSFTGSWEGEIDRLRLDLPAEVIGARYEISEIQIRK